MNKLKVQMRSCAPHEPFLDEPWGDRKRPGGIKVVKTRLRGSPVDPDSEDPLTIRHTILRDALVEALNVQPQGAKAIGTRLQLLLGMGLRRNGDEAPGRGRGYSNGLADALDAALAFTLQRAFVPPSAVVALMLEHRPELDEKWAAAARGERVSLTVVVDALSQAGRDGVRTGRFSEDPKGTVTLAGSVSSTKTSHLASAPRISVNLTDLYNVTIENLGRVGVPLADLRRAGELIAGAND